MVCRCDEYVQNWYNQSDAKKTRYDKTVSVGDRTNGAANSEVHKVHQSSTPSIGRSFGLHFSGQ